MASVKIQNELSRLEANAEFLSGSSWASNGKLSNSELTVYSNRLADFLPGRENVKSRDVPSLERWNQNKLKAEKYLF